MKILHRLSKAGVNLENEVGVIVGELSDEEGFIPKTAWMGKVLLTLPETVCYTEDGKEFDPDTDLRVTRTVCDQTLDFTVLSWEKDASIMTVPGSGLVITSDEEIILIGQSSKFLADVTLLQSNLAAGKVGR